MSNKQDYKRMKIYFYTYFRVVFIVYSVSWVCFSHSMNLLVPFNPLIRPLASNDQKAQFFFMLEGGVGSARVFNEKEKTNVLRIYDNQQNALAMLKGFSADSQESALLANIDPFHSGFDGKRGLFDVCGNLKLDVGGGFTTRYFLGHGWSINAYLPFYSMKLDDVRWNDNTVYATAEDQRVHRLLTDDFANNVLMLGDGLNIGPWHRVGFGDLAILLDLHRDFPQDKPILKNVAINSRAGLSVPTGLRADLDHIMAIPFGTNGAWALPFAFDLELTFGKYVQFGLDIQLIHIFGHTHMERVPTADNQTTLVYLKKTCVFRDFGWNQQFSLYGGIKDLPEGLSASIGYQYVKQGSSAISPVSNAVSTAIIQRSPALFDWTVHQIITRVDYNFGQWLPDNAIASPRISLFVQAPFNGKRALLFTTIGGSVAVDF